jgi:hypothetical protein
VGHPCREEGFVLCSNYSSADELLLLQSVGTNFYRELLSSTLYFFAAVSIRFQAARRSASVTSFT